MARIDLHIHSNCSDGSDTIQELYEKIRKSDIETFAITDHDTVEGCRQMELYTNNFIRGVELTCQADDIKCHILGYGCDINNKKLLNLIEKGKKLRRIKLETRVKYLKEQWNIELTKDELDWLYSRTSVVKTHFANIIVNRGLAEDTVSAMKKYIDACKTPKTRFEITEAVEALNHAGALIVWAHPLGGEGEEHLTEKDFLPKLEIMKNYGIKGLECYYSRYTKQEENFLVNCAKRNNLLISGGSDYHGTNKKNISLAKLNYENIPITFEALTILNALEAFDRT
ncbi:PHP domain-containing protein [bacterium]|nr:PHP domain-containing protein [bacterium]